MSKFTITAYPVAELPVPGWVCFFARNDTAFHNLIFYVWVITDGSKTILVDTGPLPDDVNFRELMEGNQALDAKSIFKRISSLDMVFKKSGIKSAEVDFLLITQPITYLNGSLLPEYFPKAKVLIPKAGMMEMLLETPGHPRKSLYFTQTSWNFLWHLLVENRLFLTDGPVEILPGLTFKTTGGHHPGSAGVSVSTPGGIVTILETAFLKENIDEEIPIGIAENTSLCRQAIKWYKQHSDLVLAGHDNTIMDYYKDGAINVRSKN